MLFNLSSGKIEISNFAELIDLVKKYPHNLELIKQLLQYSYFGFPAPTAEEYAALLDALPDFQAKLLKQLIDRFNWFAIWPALASYFTQYEEELLPYILDSLTPQEAMQLDVFKSNKGKTYRDIYFKYFLANPERFLTKIYQDGPRENLEIFAKTENNKDKIRKWFLSEESDRKLQVTFFSYFSSMFDSAEYFSKLFQVEKETVLALQKRRTNFSEAVSIEDDIVTLAKKFSESIYTTHVLHEVEQLTRQSPDAILKVHAAALIGHGSDWWTATKFTRQFAQFNNDKDKKRILGCIFTMPPAVRRDFAKYSRNPIVKFLDTFKQPKECYLGRSKQIDDSPISASHAIAILREYLIENIETDTFSLTCLNELCTLQSLPTIWQSIGPLIAKKLSCWQSFEFSFSGDLNYNFDKNMIGLLSKLQAEFPQIKELLHEKFKYFLASRGKCRGIYHTLEQIKYDVEHYPQNKSLIAQTVASNYQNVGFLNNAQDLAELLDIFAGVPTFKQNLTQLFHDNPQSHFLCRSTATQQETAKLLPDLFAKKRLPRPSEYPSSLFPKAEEIVPTTDLAKGNEVPTL